jgi:hypothetical protein
MKHFVLASSFLFILLKSTFGQTIPTNGLKAWYPFSGNATDQSGNGNNGTVTGASLTIDRFGNPNRAYSFDGVNNLISIPNTTSLDFNTSTDISFSCWIKTSLTTNQRIYSKRNLINGKGIEILVGDVLRVYYGVGQLQANYIYVPISFSPVTGSAFHHVVVLINNGTKKVSCYVDNINQNIAASFTNLSGTFQNTTPHVIGSGTDNNNPFQGSIDDFRIYNRILFPNEIDSLFHEANPITTGLNELITNAKLITLPNPVKERIQFSEKRNVTLSDLSGRVIIQNQYVDQIDMIGQPSGFYIITISDNSGRLIQRCKLIKD